MLLLLSLVGCMPGNVLPAADGVHSVVLLTDNKPEGAQYAKNQAKRYCKRKEKKNYFVENQTISYVCEMDEKKYIRAKRLQRLQKWLVWQRQQLPTKTSNGELVGDILRLQVPLLMRHLVIVMK